MRKTSYILFAIAFFLVILSVIGYIILNKPIQTQEYDAAANVTFSNVGFDVNSSSLGFGKVAKGSSAMRSIIFTNQYPYRVKVKINAEGDVAQFLSFEKTSYFEVNESRKIGFTLRTQDDTEEGFYVGKVILKIYRL